MRRRLQQEIQQSRPFLSSREEAFLSLLRTAGLLERALGHRLRGDGLTATQYNVLRILRGAHPGSLACGAIGARMVTPEPDVTRLLDRLEARGLLQRERNPDDRRVVVARISPNGLELLRRLDQPVLDTIEGLLAGLADDDVERMIELLEKARLTE